MLKSLVQLEHTAQQVIEKMSSNGIVRSVEDTVCKFICDHHTTFDTIKEALFQFQKEIGVLEDKSKAQEASKTAVVPPVEPAPLAPVEPIPAPQPQEVTNEHQS